ncbi:LacI family DNA-binding transcriptional regulator [Salinibacterium sp. SWN1162]|uniref:LacI family DNA-binding transcriptional regulator n=1 Tax=Salinibacterium sp. SWN1162 TaxID=2792053 RepID=UPI0018CCF50A|nr:LacI family DNA-binding transcriptional regulator [Salinibacterium sp. SWN1162]MBH0008394.1 LacI family DNA-binding transcriptional regulator [Salinibacterium sp. SWN1162]
MARVTINDIASSAGVSISAVSYALNGRKGVSETTRQRVLAVADEMGWAPSSAARSLTEAKTDTFGLVLARDPKALGIESFYMQFIAGIETELAKRSYALLLQVVSDTAAELETHRNWLASRRVDGIIVVDARVDDPRLIALSKPGALPTVLSCDPTIANGMMDVWTDDAAAMKEAVRYLARVGHRRIARIAGIAELGHTAVRDAAFREAIAESGIDGQIMSTDYTIEQGAAATRAVLAASDRATAIIYDNDLMAVGGLSTATSLGYSVPNDLSIIAWDDSALCQVTYPALTAVSHDVIALGAHVARRLFDLIDGAHPDAHLDSVPQLVIRGTTGAAPS